MEHYQQARVKFKYAIIIIFFTECSSSINFAVSDLISKDRYELGPQALFRVIVVYFFVFRQALQLYKGDPGPVILEIINTIEGAPPVDVLAIRSM